MIADKKIIITGAGGSIGSELVRQLAPENDVYGIDIDETALTDLMEETGIKGHVGDINEDNVFTQPVFHHFNQQPDYIFHAAARKHVTPMQKRPEEAIRTNILGTLNVLGRGGGAKIINISSDKAVNPDNIMGWTKLGTEMLTRLYGGISVRFGNVLGSQGSVIPIWQRQIDKGGPLTITDERMTRFFMTTEEACSLVIKAAEEGEPGDLFILDMGEPVKIIDIARRIIAESRKNVEIKTIGIRPGEKLSETLMTPEEEKRAVKKDGFYVIKEERV